MRARHGRGLVVATALLGSLALASSASAQFNQNALGPITAGGSTVTIHTSQIPGPRWFGVRVFTVPPGRMAAHNVLTTHRTDLAYGSQAHLPGGRLLCVSDFQGTGSPGGGMFGPASPAAAQADPFVAMVGGFVGSDTGCTDGTTGDLVFQMETTGPIVQAFYGAFYGDSPAQWRGSAGDVSGNGAWWNLWGNFTELAYGSTG